MTNTVGEEGEEGKGKWVVMDEIGSGLHVGVGQIFCCLLLLLCLSSLPWCGSVFFFAAAVSSSSSIVDNGIPTQGVPREKSVLPIYIRPSNISDERTQ